MTDRIGSQTAMKLTQLEAARGIASIIVIFHHFSLAFLPWIRLPALQGGLNYTPAFIVLNGPGAVTFFFMLSGFVLTYRFYQRPSAIGLTRATVKRLPRLLLPAAITILAGWVIVVSEPHFYAAAAVASKSEWLANFADAKFPADLSPTLASAVKQSLLVFLVPHDFYYNSNLWTMFDEFYGSLLVFAISAVATALMRNSPRFVVFLHVGLALLFYKLHTPLVDFVIGSGIAYWLTNLNLPITSLRKPFLWGGVLIAVVGFSCDRWMPNVCAAFALMSVLLGSRSAARALSGRLGASLGALSFPIYLVHTLVILGLSSWAYLAFIRLGLSAGVTVSLTLLVTLGGTALFCLPLVVSEHVWVPYLNNLVRSVLPSRAASRGTAGIGTAR